MAKKTFVKKTHEELQAELDATMKKLEDGIQGVFTSENYANYLRFYAKMHHYSFNNIILILSQLPTASCCASFKTWKDLKCPVKKGEKGLKILVPISYKQEKLKTCKDDDGNAIVNPDGTEKKELVAISRINFKIGNVFDVSQVQGDVPSLVDDLSGNEEGFEEAIEALINSDDIVIVYDEKLAGSSTHGYYRPGDHSIALCPGMSVNQTMKTLIHERAHSILHCKGGEGEEYGRHEKEVQAESVAFIVSEALGMDTSDYSFGYIAGWSKGKDIKELGQSLNLIEKTSKAVISWITENTSLLVVDGAPKAQEETEEAAEGETATA